MKIALLSAMFPELSLESLIAKLERWGYDGIEPNAEELPWAAPHVTPATDRSAREAIREAAVRHGLGISAICAHISLVNADSAAQLAAIDVVKGCIDLAKDLGTDVVHGLTGPYPPSVDPGMAWSWAVSGVKECAEYANANGIKFAMEAIVNHVVFRVGDMQRLLEELSDVPVYVNFDPSHYQVGGDDIGDAVRTFGSRIVHVHMKDAEGTPGRFTFPALGRGQVDFAGMVDALRTVGYDGYLSLEYEADRFGDATPKEEAAQRDRKFVERLLAR
jgi:sugar phosphate isomerase/epimerase